MNRSSLRRWPPLVAVLVIAMACSGASVTGPAETPSSTGPDPGSSDPGPPASPEQSCSVGIPAGNYEGSVTYASTGPSLTHDSTDGTIRFTVAANGKVTGSWDLAYFVTFGGTRSGTGSITAGTVAGTSIQLRLQGTNVVTKNDGTSSTSVVVSLDTVKRPGGMRRSRGRRLAPDGERHPAADGGRGSAGPVALTCGGRWHPVHPAEEAAPLLAIGARTRYIGPVLLPSDEMALCPRSGNARHTPSNLAFSIPLRTRPRALALLKEAPE